jgi:hypothetical protein
MSAPSTQIPPVNPGEPSARDFWQAAAIPAACLPVGYLLFSYIGRRITNLDNLQLMSARDTVLLFLFDNFIPGILIPLLLCLAINLRRPLVLTPKKAYLFALPVLVVYLAIYVIYPITYLDRISALLACFTGLPLGGLSYFCAGFCALAGAKIKQRRS